MMSFVREPTNNAPPTMGEAKILSLYPLATRGLFVGDLSSFCTEKHLFKLFSTFGQIRAIEIKRGRNGDSLRHGFVEFDSIVSSWSACESLNGRKIMGRHMRVNWTNIKVPPKPVELWTVLHVHFVATNMNQLIDEAFLDDLYSRFGKVIDVIIKRHEVQAHPPSIHGTGNVYFLNSADAVQAMLAVRDNMTAPLSSMGIFLETAISTPSNGKPIEKSSKMSNSSTAAAPLSNFNSVSAVRGPQEDYTAKGARSGPTVGAFGGYPIVPVAQSIPAPMHETSSFHSDSVLSGYAALDSSNCNTALFQSPHSLWSIGPSPPMPSNKINSYSFSPASPERLFSHFSETQSRDGVICYNHAFDVPILAAFTPEHEVWSDYSI